MNISNHNRNKWLHIRLSAIDHNELMKRRDNSTCRNLSEYVRKVLLDRPVVATYRNKSQDDLTGKISVLNRELNAIGNNLNQITKKLHTLQPLEERLFAASLISKTDDVLSKIAEVKELISTIANQWLR